MTASSTEKSACPKLPKAVKDFRGSADYLPEKFCNNFLRDELRDGVSSQVFPVLKQRRRFVTLQFSDTAPLVFLQSLEDPGPCFVTLPVKAVDPDYRLQVSAEDRLR